MNRNKITWILQVLLGLLFLYAGGRKMLDPVEFADAIAGFKSIPVALIHPVAMGLPVLEILLGLFVLLPIRLIARGGAYGIVLLNAGFIILLVSAWVRGLSVECGCFGLGLFPPSQWTLQISIVRDIIFLAMAIWVYRELGKRRLPVSKRVLA